jgi:hypothetical protein
MPQNSQRNTVYTKLSHKIRGALVMAMPEIIVVGYMVEIHVTEIHVTEIHVTEIHVTDDNIRGSCT